MNNSKRVIKKLLYPMRVALGRFAMDSDLYAQLVDYQQKNTLLYKAAALVAADKIEGDYLEFGVFSGGNFIHAFRCFEKAFHHAAMPSIWNTEEDCEERKELWDKLRFFAFDSFQGLPRLSGVDTASRDFVEGKYACSEERFLENIAGQGVPLNRIVSVSGWFQDTLNEAVLQRHNIQTAAVINIDVDLYQSASVVLDFIAPLVVDGTVIIFDDWYNYRGNPDLGEQRACREWLVAHPDLALVEYNKEGPWKNSFIVQKTRYK